ncbi:MAG: phosphotransferase [Bacilli bacterium]|nr:phosphotransferase [Bacilli bacterium]
MIQSFPKEISGYIGDNRIVKKRIGRSNASVYEIIGADIYLKRSLNTDSLRKERDIYLWLKGKIRVPEVIFWFENKNEGFLLMSKIKGNNLISNRYLKNPEKLISLLVCGLKEVHKIDLTNCPFTNEESISQKSFVHGDFCLPNIMIYQNKISGFIDMSDAGIGDPYIDIAWAWWSLCYNLKTRKYEDIFFDKLNLIPDFNKISYYTKNVFNEVIRLDK